MRISLEVFEPASDGAVEVSLYLDSAGREHLVRELLALNFPTKDHFHVFSPAWGAPDELMTEEKRHDSSHIGRHFKVYIRPNGEKLFTPGSEANLDIKQAQ